MKAKSLKGKSVSALREALANNITDTFKPTLAIVFSSVCQDIKGICDELDQRGITIFGCTTNGEFIDEGTEKESWVLMLLDIKKDHFQLYFEEYPKQNYRQIANVVAKKVKVRYNNPAFILGISNAAADGEEILRGIIDVFGEQVNVFGGGAGDDYRFQETFVFTNDKISNNAMVCMALDESKIDVHGIATCGWKAVGTEKIVTKSEGNHVFTIDNIPAVDITAKFGGLMNINPDNKNLIVELAANFPLQLQKEKGDPVMRPGLVVDWSDRSFYCSGSVPQGSKVRFSLPPDFDVMEKVIKGVEQLKSKKMPEADALVVFSCAGRILSLGPLMPEEIEGIKKVWNVPMVGMFSNAEFGRATGGNLEMHNLTTCCVALKEKN
jgi:hypothetical protein